VAEDFAKVSEVVWLDYMHYTFAACVADIHGVSKVMQHYGSDRTFVNYDAHGTADKIRLHTFNNAPIRLYLLSEISQ
jgi:hypothetical protein